jgi:TonB family protein
MFVSLLAAVAAASAPQAITKPDWLTRPSASELSAVYPAHAMQHHIAGQAAITCVVNVHGLLEACQVVSESPRGEGFGAAALLLAPTISMTPAIGPAGPVPWTVTIPIRWELRGGGAPDVMWTESPYGGGSRTTPKESDASDANSGKNLIVHPTWRIAPTFADVAGVYPANARGAAGHVVLQCRVVSDGGLRNCSTVTEEPLGKGFARAAYDLVAHFHVSAESFPAKDSDPTYVDVPFRLIDPKSDEFQQRRIGAPNWRLALDPNKVAQVFPETAAAKGIATGRGVAKCSVAADGALVDCQEMPGEPDGLGFSHSAVVIAQSMAMNPWTDEGAPVDGSTIVLPIRFNLASGTPPAN